VTNGIAIAKHPKLLDAPSGGAPHRVLRKVRRAVR